MLPWQGLAVFEKGFRSIYTQKAYADRPGYWLVLQFRESKSGFERRSWVLERIPEERIGTNVPLPRKALSQRKLKRARDKLDNPRGIESLNIVLNLLLDVQKHNPELFCGEKVYLWEELAFAYHSYHNMKKAEFCLRQQASLQPGSTEAYLNLGSFFMGEGMYHAAISAFKEGLAIDPSDEFISFNLASIYDSIGNTKAAYHALNQAILKNPDRGLNHKLKGDFHLEKKAWQAAATCYLQAIELMTDKAWNQLKVACYKKLAAAYKGLDRIGLAANTLEDALALSGENSEILVELGRLYVEGLGKSNEAVTVLEKALESDPTCSIAHLYLAQCLDKQGKTDLAKWHLKKGRQIQNALSSKG